MEPEHQHAIECEMQDLYAACKRLECELEDAQAAYDARCADLNAQSLRFDEMTERIVEWQPRSAKTRTLKIKKSEDGE